MKMNLTAIKLVNFRGYINATVPLDKEMNVIIGKNDIGKSTILEALAIFFGFGQYSMEVEDKNVYCDQTDVQIACCFSVDSTDDVLIDTSATTRLDNEYLLNSKGELEIVKIWECSKSKIGAKVYIRAYQPVLGLSMPLVCEKIDSLKRLLKDAVDDSTYTIVDKTKCATIRKAIFMAKVSDSTGFEDTLVDAGAANTDAKNLWDSLQMFLPVFFLFKSDRANTDSDSEVQTPMKVATKSVISEMQSEIDSIVANVRRRVEEIGNHTLEKLAELDPEIARSLTPKVSTKALESFFSFEMISDNQIPLNKRGSGIRRLILLSYFRAEAERIANSRVQRSIIYAIEEPETSQHPDFQRMIVDSLVDLAKDGVHQIIITTHTPEIAKMVELKQLIFIDKDKNGESRIHENNDDTFHCIIETLGIHPFAVERCVICVEGENDVNFLKAINQIPEFKRIISLDECRIQIIPLQGSNLVGWVNANYFTQSNIKEIHFYDNDRMDYRLLVQTINNDSDGRRFGWNTQRPEFENYIPPCLVETEFAIDLHNHYNNWATCDVPKILVGKAMLEIKDPKKREAVIKKRLNGCVSKRITSELLREIYVFDEIEAFFRNVRKIYDGVISKA